MRCGWDCGAQLNGRNMLAHVTMCAKRPVATLYSGRIVPESRCPMADCRIKSFRASWSAWNIDWGWFSSTIELPVKFRLELEPGSSKADCVVRQMKRGQYAIGGNSAGSV